MNKAIYAFSGDPITYGHIDIIDRVSKTFDEIIVGIGVNPDKKYMFTLEERLDMATKSLGHIKNVKVVAFKGLLVDYAYEHGINTIIRGVRNSSDFEYEKVLHHAGESQKLGIDTYMLFAKNDLAHVSSSVVKSLQKEQGLIGDYVPLYVKKCLENKMSDQYIIGLTGEIGSGKSYVGRAIERLGRKYGVRIYNIDLDVVGHEIYKDMSQGKYKKVMDSLVENFGDDVINDKGYVDRKKLGRIVFNDKEKLNKLNEIMHTPILAKLRKNLYGKKGIILINAALIAESKLSYLSNNDVILVKVDKETQRERLGRRKYDKDQIEKRINSQWNFERKKQVLEAEIKEENQGKLFIIDNSKNANIDYIENVFGNVFKYLNPKVYVKKSNYNKNSK